MGTRLKPGELDFYVGLLLCIHQDAARSLFIKSSAVRADKATINRHVQKEEGYRFLTETMPSLGKALDKSLASDSPFQLPEGFKASRKRPGFPVFLGEFFERIFTPDGVLRLHDRYSQLLEEEENDTALAVEGLVNDGVAWEVVQAVRAVRQMCYLLYKLEVPYAKEKEQAVLDNFVEVDQSLPPLEHTFDDVSRDAKQALHEARLLIWHVLRGLDLEDITSKHGPGAVATGEDPRDKMKFRRIYASLDKEYPFVDYFKFNYTHLVDTLESLENLEELEYPVAKVTLVPKDSRGPRTISMEPLEIQWIQQGQRRAIYQQVEWHPLTRGLVNFTNQEVNRNLALRYSFGSVDVVPDEKFPFLNGELLGRLHWARHFALGDYATVDMKEASDRVSYALVKALFPENIFHKLEASRSRANLLPDGTLLELRKFAPMGSATCFPVEALCFWALAVGAMQHVSPSPVREELVPVYVFGDDLIIPTGMVQRVRSIFEEFSLLFNESKTCCGRFFRESCGMDALCGQSVTPVRIKSRWRRDLSPAATASYVSYHNSLRRAGYSEASTFVEANCDRQFRKLPVARNGKVSSLALVKRSETYGTILETLKARGIKVRWNAGHHDFEARLPVLTAPSETTGEPGWDELFRIVPQMGPPDPFGLRGEAAEPCSFPSPTREQKQFVGWSWCSLTRLLTDEG